MPYRKPWTTQQDKTLKLLRDQLKITKWSTIAKKMQQQYGMPDRTGKQCRQRYHNHLDQNILRTEWSPQQQKYLYALHDEIGNKWAIIAQKLPGRTDNCVKNHFYSKMRKSIRKLNKIIYQYYKKQIKQIKMTVLYKIVQATDQRFKNSPSVQVEVSEKCCRLKNLLLEYSNDGVEMENDIEALGAMARSIHEFSSKYRRRAKKTRRSSGQGADLAKLPKFQKSNKCASQCQQQDQQYSIIGSFECGEQNDESFQLEQQPKKLETIKQCIDDLKQSTNSKILPKNCLITPPSITPHLTVNPPSFSLSHQLPSQSTSVTSASILQPPSLSLNPSPGHLNTLLQPPKMGIPSKLANPSQRIFQNNSNLQEILRTKGILENCVEEQYGKPGRNAQGGQNQGQTGIDCGKMSSLADSVRSFDQEMRIGTNFLSQSIQKMNISDHHFHFDVQVEDEHKLFTSN